MNTHNCTEKNISSPMRIEINSMDDVVNFLIFLGGVNKLCAGTWNTILDNRASIL